MIKTFKGSFRDMGGAPNFASYFTTNGCVQPTKERQAMRKLENKKARTQVFIFYFVFSHFLCFASHINNKKGEWLNPPQVSLNTTLLYFRIRQKALKSLNYRHRTVHCSQQGHSSCHLRRSDSTGFPHFESISS